MSQPSTRRGPTCPTCLRPMDLRDPAVVRHRPFCSKCCQLIDLGKWFNEEYVISSPISESAARGPDLPAEDASEGS